MNTTLAIQHTGARRSFLVGLKLWQKFALLGGIVVAIATIPLISLYHRMQEQTALVLMEAAGVDLVTDALVLVKTFQDHRASSSYYVLRDEKLGAKQPEHAQAVDDTLAALETRLAAINQQAISKHIAAIRTAWTTLKADVVNRRIDQRRVTQAHIDIIRDIFRLTGALSACYKLDLIPEAATHYLVRGTLMELPQLSETIGQLRSPVVARLKDLAAARAADRGGQPISIDAALRAAFTPADRMFVDGTVNTLEQVLERYVGSMRQALAASSEVASTAAAELVNVERATRQAVALVRREILEATDYPTIDPETYLTTVSTPREAIQKLATQQELVDKHIQRRLQTTRTNTLTTMGSAVGLLLLASAVATAIATIIVRNITGMVTMLQNSVEKVRRGDFNALQDIQLRDEVGHLGRTVNDLLSERITAQQKAEQEKQAAEAENERLHNAGIAILHAVHRLSQRDLTARAPVVQGVIGPVADSINTLAAETAQVLRGVSQIAGQVEIVSGKVKSQADLVSKTAQAERQSVQHMIGALAKATEVMHRMATLAEQSNQSATLATQVTGTALAAVHTTVAGMEAIRETMAETEQRIQRLSKCSQEITGMVHLINTIAERTHTLALNVSMQAAGAGEAGRGFVLVAEEVQRLADNARTATQQIGTLLKNIQLETNETINSVNRTISQVAQGSEQAQKAGEQMRRTQEITAQLVAKVQRIAEGSEQQKQMAAQLVAQVQDIGAHTELTAQQIAAQNRETETLLSSAHQLVASVNVFRLPQV